MPYSWLICQSAPFSWEDVFQADPESISLEPPFTTKPRIDSRVRSQCHQTILGPKPRRTAQRRVPSARHWHQQTHLLRLFWTDKKQNLCDHEPHSKVNHAKPWDCSRAKTLLAPTRRSDTFLFEQRSLLTYTLQFGWCFTDKIQLLKERCHFLYNSCPTLVQTLITALKS